MRMNFTPTEEIFVVTDVSATLAAPTLVTLD
jgi:hypothetical protein